MAYTLRLHYSLSILLYLNARSPNYLLITFVILAVISVVNKQINVMRLKEKSGTYKIFNKQNGRQPDFKWLNGKVYLLLLGSIALIGFIIFRDYLVFNKVYLFKRVASDSFDYFYPYVYGVTDYIKKYGIPKWSFSLGMGQNLFPFCLRDPFNIIFYLTGKGHIYYVMAYKELVKILLGGITFFFYLKTLRLSDYTSFAGGLFFAFCGFMIVGSVWYIFSFEALNFALLLLSFELLFTRQKWYLFPLPVFLFGISQPFNLYLYGIFIASYAVLRLFQTDTFSVRNLANIYLKITGLTMLGIMWSAPFFIENMVQLIESPRGSGVNSSFHILSSAPVFATMNKLQSGTDILRFFSNDLAGTGAFFNGYLNYLEAPTFYCGLPCLLLMPQVFRFLHTRLRIVFLVFIVLWLLPVIFPYFRYALWLFIGDYYRGYSFFIAFLLMYYALLSLEYICHNRKIHLVTLFVTVVVLFILLYYPYFPPKELLNFPDKGIPNHKILVFVSIMLVVYALVLYFIGKQYFWFKSIFILLVIFEIAYLSNVTVNNIDAASAEDLSQKKAYNDYTLDAVAYVGRIDNSFFRIDKTYFSSAAWYGSFNDGLVQGYKGTSCYNPTNQLYYIHYLQLMGISNRAYESESREPIGLINRPVLESLNQVKYMLTKNSAPLFWKIACDSITATGDVKIFRNNFVLPLGFTYKYYIRESAFENIPNNQKDLVSLKACVLKDNEINKFPGLHEFELKDTFVASAFNAELYRKEINELRKDTLVLNNSGETFFRGKITVDEDKMMYLSIPYDKGWKLKVDGYPAEKIILDGGMTGVMFSPGSHSIEMVYDLRFFKKGLMLSVLGFIIYIGLWVYQKKKNPALRLQ